MAASEEKNHKSLHTAEVELRWSDFDRFGHVNNAAFIEIAQEARLAFAEDQFRERGYEIPAVFVRHLEVDYLRAILPDTTTAVVETVVTHLGNTSFTTRQEVKDRTGRVCCVVECVQVTVNIQTAAPRAISKTERKLPSPASPAPRCRRRKHSKPDGGTGDLHHHRRRCGVAGAARACGRH